MKETFLKDDLLFHATHGLCRIIEMLRRSGSEEARYVLVPVLQDQGKVRYIIPESMLAGSGFVTVGLPPSEPSKPPPLPLPEIPLPTPEKESEELPSLNDPAEPAPKDPDEPDDPNDPPEEPPPKNSSRKEPALDPLHPAVRNATVSKING